MTNWWNTATKEQKLRQIDAGIELGMSSAQIALASEASRKALLNFGNNYGRRFTNGHKAGKTVGIYGRRKKWSQDYYRGEKRDTSENPDLIEIFDGPL